MVKTAASRTPKGRLPPALRAFKGGLPAPQGGRALWRPSAVAGLFGRNSGARLRFRRCVVSNRPGKGRTTTHPQFDLVWSESGGFDGNFDRFFAGQVNGLVGASDPDGVYINLARRSGGSPVSIVLMDAPPVDNEASWEDVVEVSFILPEGQEMRWITWAGESWGALGTIPPGSYRLRVSAKGRDQGHADEFSEHSVDAYLLQMWPAHPQPDTVLRTGSEDGRYWHGEVGGRR